MSKLKGSVVLELIDPDANSFLLDELEFSNFGLESGSDYYDGRADAKYKDYAENLAVEVDVEANAFSSEISITITGEYAKFYQIAEDTLEYDISHLSDKGD